MSTALQDTIRDSLVETGGNVRATAMRLGVSEEYVRQQKEVVPAPGPVPTNPAVYRLLDSTVKSLQASVDAAELTGNQLVRLLGLLLDYDARVQTMSRPLMSVNNTTQTVNMLVQRMDSLTTEELKSLARAKPQIETHVQVIDVDV